MSTSDLLKGKVALITGCNRGIGKAIMETFAQNGADIWACARKQTNEFDGLLQELRTKYNNRITPLYFDLADESAIKEALNPLLVAKEKIDILVNNAGVAHGSFFQMTSISKIKEVFEINFFSQLLVTQIVAKLMMKQKSGSIINLASIAGMDGNPGYVSYGSGKAALIYATKSIAKEFAANNVRVNAIAPGLTETAMADQMEEKAKALMINSSAMNRLAQPQEIANTALFLASDLSQFITGQVIRVDGGS
jgi:3-oxoacyl-[acyl-carrier protein] reductase